MSLYVSKEEKSVSDFFYKQKLGGTFSPVINVKHQNISPTVVSAIDNLLSPGGNMFTRAETVRNLMEIEKLDLDKTAKALSLKKTDVANKLRLLEFSEKERGAILEYSFSEASALQFLRLDKISRLYAMEFCRKSGYCDKQIEGYVDGIVNTKQTRKNEISEKIDNVRKFIINDIGFFLNSIENALRIARKAGFEVDNRTDETKDKYEIHISIKKKNTHKSEVDKRTQNEYND